MESVNQRHIASRILLGCAVLLALLGAALAVDVSYGETNVPVESVARVAASHLPFGRELDRGVPETERMIVWHIRVPRALLGCSLEQCWPWPAWLCRDCC